MSSSSSSRAALSRQMFGNAPKQNGPSQQVVVIQQQSSIGEVVEEKIDPRIAVIYTDIQQAKKKLNSLSEKEHAILLNPIIEKCKAITAEEIKKLSLVNQALFKTSHAQVYGLLYMAYCKQGARKNAIKALSEAIKISPTYLYHTERARHYEALVNMQGKDSKKVAEYRILAENDYIKAREMKPNTLYAHLLHGNFLINLGENFAEPFTKAFPLRLEGDIVSENLDICIGLDTQARAVAACVAGLFQSTLTLMDRADYSRVKVVTSLIETLMYQDEPIKKVMDEYFVKHGLPNLPARMYRIRGLAFLSPKSLVGTDAVVSIDDDVERSGESIAFAISYFTKAIDVCIPNSPLMPSLLYLRSYARRLDNSFKPALDDILQAIKLEPNNLWFYPHWASILIGLYEYRSADRVLKKSLKKLESSKQADPNNTDLKLFEGKVKELLAALPENELGYPSVKRIVRLLVDSAWDETKVLATKKQMVLNKYPNLSESKGELSALDFLPFMSSENIIWLDEICDKLDKAQELVFYGSFVPAVKYHKVHHQILKQPKKIDLFAVADKPVDVAAQLATLGFQINSRWRNGCNLSLTRAGQTFNLTLCDSTYVFGKEVTPITTGRIVWSKAKRGFPELKETPEFKEACEQKVLKVNLPDEEKPVPGFYARVLTWSSTQNRLQFDPETTQKILENEAWIKEYFQRSYSSDQSFFYNELAEMVRKSVFACKAATPIINIVIAMFLPDSHAHLARSITRSLQQLSFSHNVMQELYCAIRALFEYNWIDGFERKLSPIVMRTIPLKEEADKMVDQLFAKITLPGIANMRRFIEIVSSNDAKHEGQVEVKFVTSGVTLR